MQFTALATMLFAALAIANPIAANVKNAIREAEPIMERASCGTTSCGIARACPSNCGGCLINPQFGGGTCLNK